MFSSMNNDRRLSDGQSSSRTSVSSVVLVDSQDSSWMGLLSRPALSLLRRLRLWSVSPVSLVGQDSSGTEEEFLTELKDLFPLTHTGPPHLTFMGCQHLGEPGAVGSVPWLTAVSVGDVGPHSLGDTERCQETHSRSLSSVRTLLNPQDLVRGGSAGKGGPWWGSLLWDQQTSQGGSLPDGGTETDQLCPPAAAGTKTPPVQTASVLEWMLGETSRPPHNKSPHTGGSTQGGQDLGYSSLQEELQSLLRVPGEELDPLTPVMEEQQDPHTPVEGQCGGAGVLSAPQCQNKIIAFIMGCPCSDDSQSESSAGEEEEDDGFNSDGSSDWSDDEDDDEDDDDDEEEEDSEQDSDSERLWTSFSPAVDPYNPQNFTAHLQTGRAPPQTPPQCCPSPLTSCPPPQEVWDDSTSSSEVDEAESLRLLSSLSCSSDPYSPFNFQAPSRTHAPPGPPRPARTRVRSTAAPLTAVHDPTCPPEYRKDEAEDRLDSGFSEAPPPASSSAPLTESCRKPKKVRFCDHVDEFFTSCGEEEDRRGPWEELARDRCRFQRRCEEVEQSIGFCLQPQHRLRVLQRLAVPSDC